LAELTRLSQEMGLYGSGNGSGDLPPLDQHHVNDERAN
jgi:hypothetical protein